jgi:hypothetical protein
MANQRLLAAKAEHEKYLKKMGCHPTQLKANRSKKRSKFKLPAAYFESKGLDDIVQGNETTGNRRDIIANVYKENPHIQFLIRQKAARTASLVNKGASQYITEESDPKTFGRK